MRQILIDANELKKILPKFILEEAEVYIDETEEIEAIPIEWIKKWVDNIKYDNRYKSEYIELNGDITHIVYKGTEITRVPCITDMLEDWEKENECRGTDKSNEDTCR